ncbi:MAG: hypothetical protein IPP89_14250 [Saprospiraceae bacterium]|nr:hypothetical protein [Candidatus Brachybacter algidus]MBL0120098.1 hypothetical protein [Candidatus Brachybacter algidus]
MINPTPSYTFTSDGISYSEGDTITACNQQVLEIEITSPMLQIIPLQDYLMEMSSKAGRHRLLSIIQRQMQERVNTKLELKVHLAVL